MYNQGQFIMRSLLQKPNIVKQSFQINKKIYNLSKYKNRQQWYNYIISKKMHTNSTHSLSGGNGPNLNIIVFIMTLSISSYLYLFNSTKK